MIMPMDAQHLCDLITVLRDEGSDNAEIEAKLAHGGLPSSTATTLSALANRPGGGVIILGLDEEAGFAVRGLPDAPRLSQALVACARQRLSPAVQVDVSVMTVEGADLVVAEVCEASAFDKPVRLGTAGPAYLRGYDGDYRMSELEIRSLLANRGVPRFDRAPVPGASLEDLDPVLVADYQRQCRHSQRALNRFDDAEILRRTGVVDAEGTPTMAGLLALGLYPQQFFPALVVRAGVEPSPGDPPGTRASDLQEFRGPIPLMLEDATSWVSRNTRTRVRFGPDGHGRDEPEYPTAAVRELVVNAMTHRDLGPHALGYPVTLTVRRDRLVVANPGGLWGITADRLGKEPVSSARNADLLAILKNVRTGDGHRVVEGLATGIRTVLDSVRAAGMVEPAFVDHGVRFAVLVPHHALLAEDDIRWVTEVVGERRFNDAQRHALAALRHGHRWTNRSYRDAFPRDSTVARTELQALVDAGLVEAVGDRGGRTYRLASTTCTSTTGKEGHPPPDEPDRPAATSGDQDRAVLATLATGELSLAQVAARAGLTRPQARRCLNRLRDEGLVVMDGAPGIRGSRYRRATGLAAEGGRPPPAARMWPPRGAGHARP